jgi:hypothetical protein
LEWKILVYIMDIWYFYGNLVYVYKGRWVYFVGILYNCLPFWYVVPREIWQPWCQQFVRETKIRNVSKPNYCRTTTSS